MWISSFWYEKLPLLYAAAGLLCLLLLGKAAGFSALLLFGAAALVSWQRYQYRRA